jgi:hypothetical protein
MVVQPSFWNLVRTQPTDFITHTHFGGEGGETKRDNNVYMCIFIMGQVILTMECGCLGMFVLDFVFVFCYFILQLLDYVEHGR